MVPMTTTDIVACPEGRDSLVSSTSRLASGGRGRSMSALRPRNTTAAPAIAPNASMASAKRLRHSDHSATSEASTAIDTVLPISVTATATVVSPPERTSSDSLSTARSVDVGPTSAAPT
jgi:hypothetical protein